MELCCGNGENLEILKKIGFKNLYGIDVRIFPETKKSNPEIKYIECDARKVPIGSGQIDLVLCLHSLHHLESISGIKDMLLEGVRLLKKGGRIAIVDHYNSFWLKTAFWIIQRQLFIFPKWLRMFGRQIKEEDILYVNIPERHAKVLEHEIYDSLSNDEKETLDTFLEIRRKGNPFWAK